jgi:hypothetical protein
MVALFFHFPFLRKAASMTINISHAVGSINTEKSFERIKNIQGDCGANVIE